MVSIHFHSTLSPFIILSLFFIPTYLRHYVQTTLSRYHRTRLRVSFTYTLFYIILLTLTL